MGPDDLGRGLLKCSRAYGEEERGRHIEGKEEVPGAPSSVKQYMQDTDERNNFSFLHNLVENRNIRAIIFRLFYLLV